MFSYILQAASFIMLRRNLPNIKRPFRSPLGIPGAVLTIVIGLVHFEVSDPFTGWGSSRSPVGSCWVSSTSHFSLGIV